MERLTSEKHNRFRETPQDNFHDHTIFPPDDEFYPVFQSESLRNQVPSIGKETHLGVRNPFSVDKAYFPHPFFHSKIIFLYTVFFDSPYFSNRPLG